MYVFQNMFLWLLSIREYYQYQRSPSQENQLRIDRCDSKGSKRPKGCPRTSFSYSTDAYCSWYCKKDEAQERQRWMGRHARSSALLEHYRLSRSCFTLRHRNILSILFFSFTIPSPLLSLSLSIYLSVSYSLSHCPKSRISLVPFRFCLVLTHPVSSLVEDARWTSSFALTNYYIDPTVCYQIMRYL